MDVMVAQSAGFCYGVKRAVDMARGHSAPGKTLRDAGQHYPQCQRGGGAGGTGDAQRRNPGRRSCPAKRWSSAPTGRKKRFLKAGGAGRPVRQRYLPQCAAYPAACGPGPGGGEDAPYHRRAPSPGGHGCGQLVGSVGNPAGTGRAGKMAGGGRKPPGFTPNGGGTNYLCTNNLGKVLKKF